MKKQIFILGKHHSTVDVITNSSSEIFILESITHTEEQIKELCKSLLDTYNKFDKNKCVSDLKFEDTFGYIGYKKAYEIAEIVDGYSCADDFMKSHKLTDEIMVIESAGDNSIPYEIQSYLEAMSWSDGDKYGWSKRIHLG